MSLPTWEEYLAYHKAVMYKTSGTIFRNQKKLHKDFVSQFSSIDVVFNQEFSAVKRFGNIIIYLALKNKIAIPKEYLLIHVLNADKIIKFFNPGKEHFFKLCEEHSKQVHRLYSSFLRAMLFWGKNDIDEIIYEDIDALNCEAFIKSGYYAKSFIDFLQFIFGRYTGNPLPKPYKAVHTGRKDDLSEYGTGHPELLEVFKQFLDEEYIQLDIPTKNPKKQLKTFMVWLYENHYEIDSFKTLNRSHYLEYKQFLENQYVKPSVRRNKLVSCVKFFKWVYANNYTENFIVYADEKIDISNSEVYESTESRHFKSREQFKLLLATVYSLEPQDEREELFKHLILIASATGFRLNEVLWLGPGCITETSGDVGEVILQINEKQGVQNKPTSILPWGIESIRFLEKRFQERSKGIKPPVFYHAKSRRSYPSLFELDGKILSVGTANAEINEIIKELESEYQDRKITFKKGAKFHAFRHQKFNDIGEVTGGSTTAVQMDSYHQNTAMIARYLEQTKSKRQEEAYKALEEGEIVGRGAEILKLLLLTPYFPETYVEMVKKMNIASHATKEGLKEAMKFLGFGFCSARTCKVKAVCEECDYFWTCSSYKNELADRYAINFTLVKAHENDILDSEGEYSLITSLKYQEKWLIELGCDPKYIEELRTKFIEGWSY